MDSLNQEYIGKNLDSVKTILEDKGYIVQIKRLEPKKDKDILNEELVIQALEKDNKNIVITTSMFKKYI